MQELPPGAQARAASLLVQPQDQVQGLQDQALLQMSVRMPRPGKRHRAKGVGGGDCRAAVPDAAGPFYALSNCC